MNYKKLFAMQKDLDKHIEEKHQLHQEDLFDRKVLALFVELGELANETRCFKFWSVKPSSPRETVLEEFVDGIHFILSLGLECDFEHESEYTVDVQPRESAHAQFLFVYELISNFQNSKKINDYRKLFSAYIDLGELLGFHAEDIERAYMEKNEVNYERQRSDY